VLNQPTPPPFRESVRIGEQNLYTRAKDWLATGIRGKKSSRFRCALWIQTKTGAGLGLPVLVAFCGSLLSRNTRGGTIVVGALNLGGSVELIPSAIRIAELAIDKQAQTLLMPLLRAGSSTICPMSFGRRSASSSTRIQLMRC